MKHELMQVGPVLGNRFLNRAKHICLRCGKEMIHDLSRKSPRGCHHKGAWLYDVDGRKR